MKLNYFRTHNLETPLHWRYVLSCIGILFSLLRSCGGRANFFIYLSEFSMKPGDQLIATQRKPYAAHELVKIYSFHTHYQPFSDLHKKNNIRVRVKLIVVPYIYVQTDLIDAL